MTREKLLQQVCVRLGDDVVAELDLYVREREREARIPLSRSLGVREILEEWATARRPPKDDDGSAESRR